MAKLPILLLMAAIGPGLSAQTQTVQSGRSAQAGVNPRGQPNESPFNQEQLSVGRFEQLLDTLHGKRDGAVAHRLAGVELTERASDAKLAQWQTAFPGQRTREALLALADASAFLDPPAEQIPATPRPELPEMKQIMTRAVDYVNKTVPRLPNFSALRTTTRFEMATPAELVDQQQMSSIYQLTSAKIWHRELGPASPALSKGARLYFLGSWEKMVTFRGGREVEEAPTGAAKSGSAPPLGLTTRGEFGPVLYIVLGDAMKGKIAWGRWEQGANGRLAVFRYEVPKEVSRYALESPSAGQPDFPAYHGEIAVDPASGTIFRITIQSSGSSGDSVTESAILVEYGPVLIGNKIYISPIHGVARSKSGELKNGKSAASAANPPAVFLNDVSFTGYHVFRAETRILPAGSPEP
jgi:hypothetical protein